VSKTPTPSSVNENTPVLPIAPAIATKGSPGIPQHEAGETTLNHPVTQRERVLASIEKGARLLFGPRVQTDTGSYGGYDLYLTSTPGHFIVKGPLESVPCTRGQEKGNPQYLVRAFSTTQGEMRGGDCDEGCECDCWRVYGTCKHHQAVKLQIAQATAIVAVAAPPRYEPVQRRAESARPGNSHNSGRSGLTAPPERRIERERIPPPHIRPPVRTGITQGQREADF